MRHLFRPVLFGLALSAATLTGLHPVRAGPALALESASEGKPTPRGFELPDESYTPVVGKRLAKAEVLWINFDLLREWGIEIPNEGLTPAFERRILDSFAYMIPGPGDPPDAFLDKSKTFYADAYGGTGTGKNWGSGRAASAGRIQIKGFGVTPMVGDFQKFDHAHGGASIEEAIREAIWGEILDRELSNGANRVVAILSTGTSTPWEDGSQEARALIVREDPLRPAHFINNRARRDEKKTWDRERTRLSVQRLERALPDGPEGGFQNFADRVAKTYAQLYAKRLFHGAATPSNIEMNGGALDYGTQTMLPGYGKAKTLTFMAPFGEELNDVKRTVITEFVNSAKRDLPEEVSKHIPLPSVLSQRLEKRYETYLYSELLRVTGAPSELIEKMRDSKGARKLFEEIKKIATAVTQEISVDKSMPASLTENDLNSTLRRWAELDDWNEAALTLSAEHWIPDEAARKALAKAYLQFTSDLTAKAATESISAMNLHRYMEISAGNRNKKPSELYRPIMQEQNIALVDRYLEDGDRSLIWDSIDRRIRAGLTEYDGLGEFQVVTSETQDLVHGSSIREIFDAQTGQSSMVLRTELNQGKGYFLGHALTEADFSGSFLRYSTDQWKSHHEIKPRISNGFVEYTIPISRLDHELEFALRSEDGKKWWKKGNHNARVILQTQARDDQTKRKDCLESLFFGLLQPAH